MTFVMWKKSHIYAEFWSNDCLYVNTGTFLLKTFTLRQRHVNGIPNASRPDRNDEAPAINRIQKTNHQPFPFIPHLESRADNPLPPDCVYLNPAAACIAAELAQLSDSHSKGQVAPTEYLLVLHK